MVLRELPIYGYGDLNLRIVCASIDQRDSWGKDLLNIFYRRNGEQVAFYFNQLVLCLGQFVDFRNPQVANAGPHRWWLTNLETASCPHFVNCQVVYVAE